MRLEENKYNAIYERIFRFFDELRSFEHEILPTNASRSYKINYKLRLRKSRYSDNLDRFYLLLALSPSFL